MKLRFKEDQGANSTEESIVAFAAKVLPSHLKQGLGRLSQKINTQLTLRH
jgi:hypothetical protein